jgi:hypothetical protein
MSARKITGTWESMATWWACGPERNTRKSDSSH